MQHVLINFLKFSNLHGLITSCTFINFWKFSDQLDFFTNDFWKIPTCMALLHPARLLILGNFLAKLNFPLMIFKKFQPAWPYYILHVYSFWEIFQPAWLLHPACLLDRLEYVCEQILHYNRSFLSVSISLVFSQNPIFHIELEFQSSNKN